MTDQLLQALQVLVCENISDFVYEIRSAAREADAGYKGNSWEHPRVRAFDWAAATVEKAVLEAQNNGTLEEPPNHCGQTMTPLIPDSGMLLQWRCRSCGNIQ